MPNVKTRWIVLGIFVSFMALVGTVVGLRAMNAIGFEEAVLMLVALMGLYIGFGILIAVYRLMGKLE